MEGKKQEPSLKTDIDFATTPMDVAHPAAKKSLMQEWELKQIAKKAEEQKAQRQKREKQEKEDEALKEQQLEQMEAQL